MQKRIICLGKIAQTIWVAEARLLRVCHLRHLTLRLRLDYSQIVKVIVVVTVINASFSPNTKLKTAAAVRPGVQSKQIYMLSFFRSPIFSTYFQTRTKQ